MASTISPNMNLVVPSVGAEPGPQYATDINNSLTLIDQHDHSPGKGVQITPAGMNINATLTFNGNAATNLSQIDLAQQASASSTLGSVYSTPGGGTGVSDLWYTDFAGNQIQITKSGQVNVIASSIPGESYSAGTFVWDQTQSSLPTTPANFDIGSITLRPNIASTTAGTQLVPPSSGNYTLNLPVPQTEGYSGVPNFLTMNNSGAIINTYYLDDSTLNASGNVIQVAPGGITDTQIANSTITGSKIASDTITPGNMSTYSTGYASSATITSFSTTSTTPVVVASTYNAHNASDRPVFAAFTGTLQLAATPTGYYSVTYSLVAATLSPATLYTGIIAFNITSGDPIQLPLNILGNIYQGGTGTSSAQIQLRLNVSSGNLTASIASGAMNLIQV